MGWNKFKHNITLRKKDIVKENDTKERIGGTVSSCIQSHLQGVQILRVHDVKEIN